LPRLTAEDSLALVQSMPQNVHLSESLRQAIVGKAAGNPFFLEELTRAVEEHGGPPATRHMPDTIQAVLAARIDRLPPGAKRLLQAAAVLGSQVSAPLVQAITELSEDTFTDSLRHLQAAEFLYETDFAPEPVYTFTHVLTQEVAYGSLLHERRRMLHAHIMEALERLAGDRLTEKVEQLAHHAYRAQVWDKAVTYCQQAGENARNRGAFREAVTSFGQALDALGHLPERPDTGGFGIELHYDLGNVLSLVGEHVRSITLLGEAEVRARQRGDRVRLGKVLSRMVTVRTILGDFDGAMAAGLQALGVADSLQDPALKVHASYRLGALNARIGNYGRAAEMLQGNVEALARSTPGEMRGWCIKSQARLAKVLSLLGEFAEGRRHGEEALRLAIVAGQWQADAPISARANLGSLYLGQGDLEAAIRVFEDGLALCRASDDKASLGPIAGDLGEAYAHTGRLAKGLALLEEARRHDLRTGALGGDYVAHLRQLSAVYLLAGRVDEAFQHACQALDLARQLKASGEEAHALFQLANVHAHARRPDGAQAEACYREALTLAEELGMRPLQAHCHLGLGTLYTQLDRPAQARAELSIAIKLYRAMQMTFWLPGAEAALAQIGR
jgi:tetratricopeptide (TPR) repeat protein